VSFLKEKHFNPSLILDFQRYFYIKIKIKF